jgi:hypothetical protein
LSLGGKAFPSYVAIIPDGTCWWVSLHAGKPP